MSLLVLFQPQFALVPLHTTITKPIFLSVNAASITLRSQNTATTLRSSDTTITLE